MKRSLSLAFLLIALLAPIGVNAECSKKIKDNGFIKETLDLYFAPDKFGPKPHSLNDWCYDKKNNRLFIVINYNYESEATAKDLAKSIGHEMIMTSRTMKQVNQQLSPFQKHILSKGLTVIITWPGRKSPAAWVKMRP